MAQFLSNLPVGALIKFGKHKVGSEAAQPIIWIVADKNHSGYPANSVTLITQKIIDLRAYDAWEGDDEDIDTDPEYPDSNINQWLNSAASSNWFVKKGSKDNPPDNVNTNYNTGYSTRPGFLYNFTTQERIALLPTTHTFPIQHLDGSFTTAVANVFLPSLREVLGVTTVNDKTTRLQYFATKDVTCGLTAQAYTNTSCTDKPVSIDSTWDYFTRSAAYNNVYGVSSTGTQTNISSPDGSGGIRPMVNISVNTKISDEVDNEGCYTVLTQVPPVISGTNSDIGTKSSAFSQSYTVTDADNDNVTVTEYIDNVKVRSYVATLGATNNLAVTGETWIKLTNGTHTLTITATDGFDETTRTFTFTKSVTTLVVQRSTPIESTTEPKSIIISVVKVIPQEATFKVEVCRNGFDTSPYWEDITSKVLSGKIHEFDTDHTKTASKWGINVMVTIDRNGGAGACYIKEIGGNFE
jgi:hypothetical protein